MTRKHFRAVAAAITKIENERDRRMMAETTAEVFAGLNPRFNRCVYMDACGVAS